MVITVKYGNGECLTWSFRYANDLDKLVKALAQNIEPGWATIEISINTLGPNLK